MRETKGLSIGAAISFALHPVARRETVEDRPSPLTPRETEVAELVAQGLRNKEIAASLVVSIRTVDGHVERIRSELGFSSRAQLATWSTRRAE